MPELDADVFQWVALGLLGLLLLTLLLAVVTLGRIRRAVERSVAVAEALRDQEPALKESQGEHTWESALRDTGRTDSDETITSPALRANTATQEPSPVSSHEEPQPSSTATSSGQMRQRSSEGVLDTGAYLRAHSSRQEMAGEPAATGQPLRVQESSDAGEHATIAKQQDPEEQPFERDGRWWFRRDGELLLYDERTGQWGPAPEQDPSATVVSPTVTRDTPGAVTASGAAHASGRETDVTTAIPVQTPAAIQQGQPVSEGAFWKCRSCGAINAGEATSCRMCFTPKGLS